ncbi:hypothetical protein GQ53DRAFT_413800 [Thozetella sp. PMI_491]|nr:hypothetical protein GQ53DRAFT_413800 [Thozetella sp. PMI_491]
MKVFDKSAHGGVRTRLGLVLITTDGEPGKRGGTLPARPDPYQAQRDKPTCLGGQISCFLMEKAWEAKRRRNLVGYPTNHAHPRQMKQRGCRQLQPGRLGTPRPKSSPSRTAISRRSEEPVLAESFIRCDTRRRGREGRVHRMHLIIDSSGALFWASRRRRARKKRGCLFTY